MPAAAQCCTSTESLSCCCCCRRCCCCCGCYSSLLPLPPPPLPTPHPPHSGLDITPPPLPEGPAAALPTDTSPLLHSVLVEARVHKTPAEVALMRYVNQVGSAAHVAMMQVGGGWCVGAQRGWAGAGQGEGRGSVVLCEGLKDAVASEGSRRTKRSAPVKQVLHCGLPHVNMTPCTPNMHPAPCPCCPPPPPTHTHTAHPSPVPCFPPVCCAGVQQVRPRCYEYQAESIFRHYTYTHGGCRNQGEGREGSPGGVVQQWTGAPGHKERCYKRIWLTPPRHDCWKLVVPSLGPPCPSHLTPLHCLPCLPPPPTRLHLHCSQRPQWCRAALRPCGGAQRQGHW
jgi:hypothetical protein